MQAQGRPCERPGLGDSPPRPPAPASGATLQLSPTHRILNSCTDLMKVSGQLGPGAWLCGWDPEGAVSERAVPRVRRVSVLPGHPAPGDDVHQPAEGDRGEWQGEWGLQVGPSLLGRSHSDRPRRAVTPAPSLSWVTPTCGTGLLWARDAWCAVMRPPCTRVPGTQLDPSAQGCALWLAGGGKGPGSIRCRL